MVVFEPVLSSHGATYSHLIILDDRNLRILVDLGWDADLSLSLEPLENLIPSVDLILFTHATLERIGSLAWLYKYTQEIRRIPCYATLPVVNLGKLVTIEAYRSKGLTGPLSEVSITQAEIEEAFDNINLIKYSQPVNLSAHNPRLDGLHITGLNSGHTLGGTIWKLESSSDFIIVSFDWNHSKDQHLNGGFIDSNGRINKQLQKPQILLTTTNISSGVSAKKTRTELSENLNTVLGRGGSVLIPISLTRVLELMLVLENYLKETKQEHPIIFLSSVSKRVVDQASSMLEWMTSSIINSWQIKNESPFDSMKIRCIKAPEELSEYSGIPKIILCSDENLLLGYSRLVFADIVQDQKNCIILTEKAAPNSLAMALSKIWSLASTKTLTPLTKEQVPISLTIERALKGPELAEYERKLEETQKEEQIQAAIDKRNKDILEADDSSDNEEDDDQVFSGQIGTGVFIYGEGIHDYQVPKDDKVCMFPLVQPKRKGDEYGEFLKPGHFEKVHDGYEEDAVEESKADYPEEIENPLPTSTTPAERPIKRVTTEVMVRLACSINCLDFNGLTDARSFAMIIDQLKPRQLLTLPGDPKALKMLKQDYITASGKTDVELLDRALILQLNPDLQDKLKWQEISGNVRVAHVTGKLEVTEEPESKKRKIVLGASSGGKQPAMPILVGEIKLTELKRKLSGMGFKAEFRGSGVLVINESVTVRRLSDGSFIIEGGLETNFYGVRQVVKSFLATV